MKSDVELSLPRKKEIILNATMTKHEKNFQDHLIQPRTQKLFFCVAMFHINLFMISFLLDINLILITY
ncbi:hypothetical protein RND81_06G072900 [Saponaria officinalis]|uniref:Uncharacterized protein n=1 Tax=Saponaria officinalis TaxID=3572 RepID=A0AAW1K4C6_SAPOF